MPTRPSNSHVDTEPSLLVSRDVSSSGNLQTSIVCVLYRMPPWLWISFYKSYDSCLVLIRIQLSSYSFHPGVLRDVLWRCKSKLQWLCMSSLSCILELCISFLRSSENPFEGSSHCRQSKPNLIEISWWNDVTCQWVSCGPGPASLTPARPAFSKLDHSHLEKGKLDTMGHKRFTKILLKSSRFHIFGIISRIRPWFKKHMHLQPIKPVLDIRVLIGKKISLSEVNTIKPKSKYLYASYMNNFLEACFSEAEAPKCEYYHSNWHWQNKSALL